MLYGQSQHSEFIKLSVHGTAHGHKGGQLCDVSVHLVTSTLLNLTVVLSAEDKLNKDLIIFPD